jgi:hypothetical protein
MHGMKKGHDAAQMVIPPASKSFLVEPKFISLGKSTTPSWKSIQSTGNSLLFMIMTTYVFCLGGNCENNISFFKYTSMSWPAECQCAVYRAGTSTSMSGLIVIYQQEVKSLVWSVIIHIATMGGSGFAPYNKYKT